MRHLASQVSVVIPTMGRNPSLLRRAVRSIYRGCLCPAKTIVALDAAAVISWRELEAAIAGDWPNLIIVASQKHGNAAATYNAGLAEVETEWVDFLDDDDEWLAGRLEAITGVLSETNADVVFAGSISYRDELGRLKAFDSRGFQCGSIPSHQGLLGADWVRAGNVFGRSSGGAYRVSLLRRLGAFDESLAFGEWTDLYRRLPASTKAVSLPGAWKMKDRTPHPSFAGRNEIRGDAVAAFLTSTTPKPNAWAAVLIASRPSAEFAKFSDGIPASLLPLCVDGKLRATSLLGHAYAGCLSAGAQIVAVVHENHPVFVAVCQNAPPKSIWRDAFLNRGEAECASLGIELIGQIGLLGELEGILVQTLAAWLPQRRWTALLEELLARPHEFAVVGRPHDKQGDAATEGTMYWIPRHGFVDLVKSPFEWSLHDFVQSAAHRDRTLRQITTADLQPCKTWADWGRTCSFAIREQICDGELESPSLLSSAGGAVHGD